MDEIWTRLENFLRQNAPLVYSSLAPGATEQEIADAEEACGVTFPPDVRQSYLRHDGQAEDNEREQQTFIPGYFSLFPLRGIFTEAEVGIDYKVPREIVTDPKVKRVYDDPAWIAFACNVASDSLKMDFAPLPGGTDAQIILWDHETYVRRVLAPDFKNWLNSIISDLEAGRLIWDEELTGYCYPEDL